jgi:hypothetical protein
MEFVVAGIFGPEVLWSCLGLLGGATAYMVFGPSPETKADADEPTPLLGREKPKRKMAKMDCLLRSISEEKSQASDASPLSQEKRPLFPQGTYD